MSKQDDLGMIEGLVDSYGMYDFLDLLYTICLEKAEHIRTNWQDESLARAWEKGAHVIERAMSAWYKVHGRQ